MPAVDHILLPVRAYDLDATLTSGQAFRWEYHHGAWEGVIGKHWVRLHAQPRPERSCAQPQNEAILAQTAQPVSDWAWLKDYLQTDVRLDAVLATFPDDPPLRASVRACRGLRLLRQDPWECLASFILSSTKQIVQIRQIVGALCRGYGEPVLTPPGRKPAWSFPNAPTLAAATEAELRACKMGFRAPNLLATARIVARGEVDLQKLAGRSLAEARHELLNLPGVGDKIANCVLLFAYGFQQAFPVDVWILKALRQLYFPKRRPTPARLRHFTGTYFGPYAGYAQQYLFHYMRDNARKKLGPPAH